MAKSANKKIGILGGSFDPVHSGHLYIASQALKLLKLDKVIFVPAYIPPHKKSAKQASPSDRIKMLRLAIRGNKKFSLSLYEVKSRGTSYSYRTAKAFRKKYGFRYSLFFIIGADMLRDLKKWKSYAELKKIVHFVVVSRPGFKIKSSIERQIVLKIPSKNISSTEIRSAAKRKKRLNRYAPERVANYIKAKGLYVKNT